MNVNFFCPSQQFFVPKNPNEGLGCCLEREKLVVSEEGKKQIRFKSKGNYEI